MSAPSDYVAIAVSERSGCDESVHFGAVVCLDATGHVAASAGNVRAAIYPRSCTKPLQAVAMVRAGLGVADDELALVCASHDGSPAHLAVARRILARAGLDETALCNTADLPLDDAEAEAVLRSGGTRTPLQMNCSGKHAAMLATCVCNGWAHDASYLHPGHPLQVHIGNTIADLAGESPSHIGVDGCGAPAHVISLVGLARSFRAIATGAAGEEGTQVQRAMGAHPHLVGGEHRDVTAFMRGVPGLMAKDGAEGVFAAALPDGRAVALKIADGANRARPPVMIAALTRLGIETDELAAVVVEHVRGHGRSVGHVRSLF